MKTSVIEVHDMLSVWSVEEVEKRIGGVPGVESVTVNHAAKSATVRYDATRLQVAAVLAIDRGLASLRFALFKTGESLAPILTGKFERIGSPEAGLVLTDVRAT